MGALSPENVEIAEFYMTWKTLGDWALEHIHIECGAGEAYDITKLIYELELENRRLKQQWTITDDKGHVTRRRMIWDSD